jgi:hypothetical protein
MNRKWTDFLFVLFSMLSFVLLLRLSLYFFYRSVVKSLYFLLHEPVSVFFLISLSIVIVMCIGLVRCVQHAWREWNALQLQYIFLNTSAQYDESRDIWWSNAPHQEAYTFGLFAPQILLSQSVRSALNSSELEAVIAHERFHQRHFHPLAFWCIEAIVQLFWFIPLIRCVKDFFEYIAEVWADRFSVHSVSVTSVASAFLKMVKAWQQPAATCSIVGFAASSERIEHLLNQKRCLWCRFPKWCFLAAVCSLLLLALFFHFCTVELADIFL